LSRGGAHRTSAIVADLFDMELRALRRDRAARTGPELFLLERAFADCLERIALAQRGFASALLIGCPDARWKDRLAEVAATVDVVDPGRLFAEAAGGEQFVEDARPLAAGSHDLVLAVGTLDTVNDLPGALRLVRAAMRPDSLFIGAMSGGETLPRLRQAMRAADEVSGAASPHVHPRIEGSALAPLLAAAGFGIPVVDVDRVQVTYGSLRRLVADLRAMGATNVLTARSRRSLSPTAAAVAAAAFERAADGARTVETFEILHFAAWTESAGQR
jgi:hypothetical protein